MSHILIIGTCDTKLEELLFVREQILTHPHTEVTLVDVGRTLVLNPAITVSPTELTSRHAPKDAPVDTNTLDRGQLNKYMASCAANFVRNFLDGQSRDKTAKRVSGVLSLGGSGGTSLAAAVMREALPMGFPKLIVSTIASGETGPIVGETDITLMYSIVDIAGLNSLLRTVLSNAAGAIVGMANAYAAQAADETQPSATAGKTTLRVGITMFGVTTPAVTAIRALLDQLSSLPASACPYKFEPYVFHATGHGGQAYERLVASGAIDAAIDLTTTELADLHIDGAVMSAGPTRLSAAAAAGIPQVVSLGATDMANFGAKSSVPERYVKDGRKLWVHNPSVTLMRTNAAECAEIGKFLATRLRECSKDKAKVQVWIPKGGVSLMSAAGGPFQDRDADNALFEAVRHGLDGSGIKVVEEEGAINDEAFGNALVQALVKMLG